ncbi:Holliday junction DNA helicase subunit RuvA [Amphibacillus marinus]|uniref:Holliday junction branch migration complex subunit RuvA n=1 Tax=Amphibacillus marinus TaxID=872970 RepID=A0A1H8P0K6_9BACI|nr:Holliday junction branch migration protein RuvA [Amphibacillus marinus]SEO35387.1 Holliday junction DNA helicase subunit RuvA [Amphibacillus marinus]
MINYLNGRLVELTEMSAIIDIAGVGYEVICANPFHFQNQLDEKVKIHTFHYVREDAQVLYGFRNQDEKQLFAQILNVSGIGPKGALSIVGNASVAQFSVAIEEEDERFLTQFPGVGKKTARQMILDLKGKLAVVVTQTGHSDHGGEAVIKQIDDQSYTEAIEALKALGYKEKELTAIGPMLRQEQGMTTDGLIRKGLALLMQ